jgi:hypothetical protein
VVYNRDQWQAVLITVMNLSSVKGKRLLDEMSNCQVLKDSAHCSWIHVVLCCV